MKEGIDITKNSSDEWEWVRERIWEDKEVLAQCVYPKAGDSDRAERELYRSFAIFPHQTHSINVKIVGAEKPLPGLKKTDSPGAAIDKTIAKPEEKGTLAAAIDKTIAGLEDTDGVITFEEGTTIGVITADCVPILVYAPDVRAVAALHAGWKGTLYGIVDSLFELLPSSASDAKCGADPAKMKVFFGPSISKERYEVDHELAQRFIDAGFGKYVSCPNVGEFFPTEPQSNDHDKGEDSHNRAGKPHIDLQGVNIERFLRHGVRPENIVVHCGCTFGSTNSEGQPLYPSHRRSGGAPGRLLTCISLR